MTVRHDMDFYTHNSVKSIIDTALHTSSPSVTDILSIHDVYIKYFLLTNIPLEPVQGSKEILDQLKSFFKQYNRSQTIFHIEFSIAMADFVKRSIIPGDIEDFVCCMSELNLSSIDLEYYRKHFGYSQTYNLYKSIIKRIFSCRFSHKEIGLTMLLLDNQSMCFKRLLPIFKRLTVYATDNIIDKNLVACCIALKAVIVYIPQSVSQKHTYIISLLTYLSGIVTNCMSFAFINEHDADEVLSTIHLLAGLDMDKESKLVLKGMLKTIVFGLNVFATKMPNTYEEVFAAICALEILPAIHHAIGQTAEFSYAYPILHDISVPQMNYLAMHELSHIKDRFLCAKYKSMQTLYACKTIGDDFELDRVVFYNDIVNARHPSKIFEVLGHLKAQMHWDDLIVFACHPGNQHECLPLVFDNTFFANVEHISYISLFIGSIKAFPELLLASGYLFMKSFEQIHTERKWSVLRDLFLMDTKSNDQRLVRLRCMISDYVCAECNEGMRLFVEFLMMKLNDGFVCFDPSILSFLHVILMKDAQISDELLRMIGVYLIGCVVAEQGVHKNFHELEAVYVSLALRAMILGKCGTFEELSAYIENKYYTLLLSAIYKHKETVPEKHIDEMKNGILEFVFEANDEQRAELKVALRGTESRFLSKYNEIYRTEERDVQKHTVGSV
ncbi:hypothetical protein M896_100340 [Ordospora colligata OC4]|uniref:Uncharacterized protein n=1 Tax=Ordospora colligata OC4 TaxID=1354746 RepID=A0A0B2UJ87_9MICR|nr:uncharacterized protein M896_100340 [Ordospora colligata OC4]KHN69050.1 hypothetical protein M896_100340 [Ordospora colligata OC4]TBU14331.1 hypothetical protein CWI40_100350 [Ordospora colligata]TBU14396.1 hypothetical protein CWI41_100350 [Ordospora colligata]